ncbi:MAG TPA: hypothetical protein VN175_11605 [Rhizomicrobium sp.]|jgi:hypothetical protein|nr:hypothetical protein [Rhizomicrobium sp.]
MQNREAFIQKVLALTYLMLAATACALPAIPINSDGRTLSEYLAAFNSGNGVQMDDFITAHHCGNPTEM